jgi:hypothetical protein
MSIGTDHLIQSCVHTTASSMNGVKELRKSSRMRPLVLNADSEAIVEIGIASTSQAKRDKIGNLCSDGFHSPN